MRTSHVPPWIIVSGVVMFVGAVGPWAKAFGVTIGGLDGDGAIILVGAILAVVLGVVLARTARRPRPRWALIVCALVGALCAAVAVYDWASLEGVVDSASLTDAEQALVESVVSTGWGLVLATIASVSLLAASIGGFLMRKSEVPVPVPDSAEQQ